MMENIVVIGSGRYAGVVIDNILAEGKYEIEGILCDFAKQGTKIMNFEVLGSLALLETQSTIKRGIVAIGDNYNREITVQKVKAFCPHFEFISTVHPLASVSKQCEIGKGTIIHPFAAIKYNTKIGSHCSINSHTTVSHDVALEDFVSLGAGVMVGGVTTIGRGTSLNIGATLKDRIEIGEYSVVAMGSLVCDNLPSNTFSIGNPARPIRKRNKDEGFL